jgi:hypothetical protein
MSAANRVEDSVAVVDNLDFAAIVTGDQGAVNDVEQALIDARGRVGSLSFRTGPVRAAAVVFGWVPFAGDQLRATGALLDQADSAMDTVSALLPAAVQLSQFESMFSSTGLLTGDLDPDTNELVLSLESSAQLASLSLARLQASCDELSGMRLLPLFRSKAHRGESIEDRLSSAVAMMSAAPSILRGAQRMGITVSELTRLQDTGDNSYNLETIKSLAERLAVDSAATAASASELSKAAGEAVPGSEVARLAGDLLTATTAVNQLSGGLAALVSAMQPALETLRASEGPLLNDGSTLVGSLDILVSAEPEIAVAVDDIETGVAAIASLRERNSRVTASLISLDDLIAQGELLISVGSLLRDGPKLAMDLFAADSDKTYLVIGQTSDELRAAGGFTSSAWTVRFRDGELVSSSFIPIVQFDDAAVRDAVPAPPTALSLHMDAGSLYLRDVGWDPNFPSVGELASQLYRLNRGSGVDGVIAITQWGLIDLIEAVGGVESEKGFISPGDALEIIEQGTDSEGTGFLTYLFDGLVGSVRGDSSDTQQLKLSRAIWNAFQKKDLMIYSPDESIESELLKLGWAGEFPLDSADRLGVIDSNVGWTKSDRNIQRGASYEVDLRDPGNPIGALDLTYRHTGAPIGRNCDEQRTPTTAEFAYDLARNSCYWDFFRVYTALGSEPLLSPDLPLPVNSVAARSGRLDAGSSTFAHDFDANGDYLSGLFAIEAGHGERFTIRYELPESVVELSGDKLVYSLHIVAQPGARGRSTSVRVLLPDGYELSTSSHAPLRTSAGAVTFEFDMLTDQLLVIEARSTGKGRGALETAL